MEPVRGKGSASHRIFLSYGREDAGQLANRLAADLVAVGYEVWKDTSHIRPSQPWHREVEDGLRSSDIVLAVLSPYSVRQQTSSADQSDSVCLDEISYAQFELNLPIVPVMAQPCSPPLFIHRLDYVDLSAWQESASQYEAGFRRLLVALQQAIEGKVRYRHWASDLPKLDFAAKVQSKRKAFVGRQWLFEEIEAWRFEAGERALIIIGDPGVGKSAIVAQLVHVNPGGQVLAYHFCQSDTADTLCPASFVRSLAGMIASQIPAYAACFAEPGIKNKLSEEQCHANPGTALERGILEPLQRIQAPEEGVRYILIDALDESLVHRGPAGRTRNLLELISSRIDRLPPWLRIVATTRNHPEVRERLGGLRSLRIECSHSNNQKDIEQFVQKSIASPEFSKVLAASSLSASDAAQMLCDNARGNFLYAEQALLGLQRGVYRIQDLSNLPPGLNGLYLSFLEVQFPDERSFKPAGNLLRLVLTAREPLTAAQLATASGVPAPDVSRILGQLASFLPGREVPGEPVKYSVFHKSFSDWLTSNDRVGRPFYLTTEDSHERLAVMCTAELESGRLSTYARKYRLYHAVKCNRTDLFRLRRSEAACNALLTAICDAHGESERPHETAQEVLGNYRSLARATELRQSFQEAMLPQSGGLLRRFLRLLRSTATKVMRFR